MGWQLCLGDGTWADETHDICFSTAPFSLNSLKKPVKCHLTSSFPTSNGTFVVAINCFSCIGTIEFCQFQFQLYIAIIYQKFHRILTLRKVIFTISIFYKFSPCILLTYELIYFTRNFCLIVLFTVYIRPRRCLHRLHRFCEENIAPIFNVCHLHHEIYFIKDYPLA